LEVASTIERMLIFMPLPMVHMSITENIFRNKGFEIDSQFLLGSISPDAIHMRENTTREDKRKTHFFMQEDTKIEDLFNNQLRPFFDPLRADDQRFMFAKGYISHVLTDLLWLHTVYGDFRKKIAEDHIEDARTLYYMETDQIDFNLFKNESWRTQIWEILNLSTPVDVPNILTAEEIEKWKTRTLGWFTEIAKEPDIEPKYITDSIVRQFIQDTSSQLISMFEQ
jgi:hypothetical protein